MSRRTTRANICIAQVLSLYSLRNSRGFNCSAGEEIGSSMRNSRKQKTKLMESAGIKRLAPASMCVTCREASRENSNSLKKINCEIESKSAIPLLKKLNQQKIKNILVPKSLRQSPNRPLQLPDPPAKLLHLLTNPALIPAPKPLQLAGHNPNPALNILHQHNIFLLVLGDPFRIVR